MTTDNFWRKQLKIASGVASVDMYVVVRIYCIANTNECCSTVRVSIASMGDSRAGLSCGLVLGPGVMLKVSSDMMGSVNRF